MLHTNTVFVLNPSRCSPCFSLFLNVFVFFLSCFLYSSLFYVLFYRLYLFVSLFLSFSVLKTYTSTEYPLFHGTKMCKNHWFYNVFSAFYQNVSGCEICSFMYFKITEHCNSNRAESSLSVIPLCLPRPPERFPPNPPCEVSSDINCNFNRA